MIHLRFSRESDLRKRYLKEETLSSIKYAVTRLRYCPTRTGFHGCGYI